MNEEKETQEIQEQAEGEAKETPKSEIQRAQELLDAIKQENNRKEELLQREDEMRAKEMFGGRSEAGMIAKKKEPISDIEYAKMLMNGSLASIDEKI